MIRLAIFAACSCVFAWLSRRPLRNLRSHGFYRFFAFESLLALILLNLPVWLRDPLSIRQIASYAFGLASIGLAIEGFRLLLRFGKPSRDEAVATNLGFENTTVLVTSGAYRFIRHPLYASLVALAWCAFLKAPSQVVNLAFAVAASGFLIATAIVEERENLARFGPAYAEYMRRTWRFVPFLF